MGDYSQKRREEILEHVRKTYVDFPLMLQVLTEGMLPMCHDKLGDTCSDDEIRSALPWYLALRYVRPYLMAIGGLDPFLSDSTISPSDTRRLSKVIRRKVAENAVLLYGEEPDMIRYLLFGDDAYDEIVEIAHELRSQADAVERGSSPAQGQAFYDGCSGELRAKYDASTEYGKRLSCGIVRHAMNDLGRICPSVATVMS